MSALDDAVKDYGAMRYAMTTENPARAELELLREAAFESAKDRAYDGECAACIARIAHRDWMNCTVARILRTDPERAKRMGLGWAL